MINSRAIRQIKNFAFNRYRSGARTPAEVFPQKATENILRKLIPATEKARVELYRAMFRELSTSEVTPDSIACLFTKMENAIESIPCRLEIPAPDDGIDDAYVKEMEGKHRTDSKLEKLIVRTLLRLRVKLKTNVELEFLRERGVIHRFDIILKSHKAVIEIDGCYWHGCPECFPNPTKAQEAARLRDAVIDAALYRHGAWTMHRIYEHEFKDLFALGTKLGNLLDLKDVERCKGMLDALSSAGKPLEIPPTN